MQFTHQQQLKRNIVNHKPINLRPLRYHYLFNICIASARNTELVLSNQHFKAGVLSGNRIKHHATPHQTLQTEISPPTLHNTATSMRIVLSHCLPAIASTQAIDHLIIKGRGSNHQY